MPNEAKRAKEEGRRVGRASFGRRYSGEKPGHVRYECENCGHELQVKLRPPKAGGDRQAAVIERIRKIAKDRPVEVKPGYRGSVMVSIGFVRVWDSLVIVHVGPRGSIEKATVYRSSQEGDLVRRGRVAWSGIEVYGEGRDPKPTPIGEASEPATGATSPTI